MTTTSATIEANKDLLVRAHEAFADADLDGLLELYVPEVTFIDTNDRENPYHGHDAVRDYAQRNFYDGLSGLEPREPRGGRREHGHPRGRAVRDALGRPVRHSGHRQPHHLALPAIHGARRHDPRGAPLCDPREIRSQIEG